MPEVDEIKAVVAAFRRAIDAADRGSWGIIFTDFPHGTCGPTTELLGLYLTGAYACSCRYVYGDRGSMDDNTWRSHAWLQWGEWSIDITADQFGEPPVIFACDSTWHAGWDQDPQPPGEFCGPSGWPDFPYRAWGEICRTLAEKGFRPAPAIAMRGQG